MLTIEQVKAKSTARLIGLHPVVLAAATALIERCYTRGVHIIITQGLRTIAEQNDLFAQGRTQAELNKVGLSHVTAKPNMQKVTNARGGYSNHNFGLAVDFALLLSDGKSVSWDMNRDYNSNNVKDWIEVVDEAKRLGLAWGGDWTSFKDYPHFDMTFGFTTSQLRAGAKPSAAAVDAAFKLIKKGGETVNKEVKVSVKVNGIKVSDGVLDNGITYTPARAVAEALGAEVIYDAATKTVHITSK